MESILLTIAARLLLPLLVVFAMFMLISGHDAPGGGFAAGLVLTTALALYLFGDPRRGEKELLLLSPRAIVASGLLLLVASGSLALLRGQPFLTPQHLPWELPLMEGLTVGTPLLFELGVSLVAAGAVCGLLLVLDEHSPWKS